MKNFTTRRKFIEKELLPPPVTINPLEDPMDWIKNNITLRYSNGRVLSIEQYMYDLPEWYALKIEKPELLYSTSYWEYTKQLLVMQFSEAVKMFNYDKAKFHNWLATEPTKIIEDDLKMPFGVHVNYIDRIYKDLQKNS